MGEPHESRAKPRCTFPAGHRPLVKFKILPSKEDRRYDAALLDLSETGARLLGELPGDQIFALGNGQAKLGCNIYLADKLLKTLAIARWFNNGVGGDFEFGVQFLPNPQLSADIKRFLIRHQIDTRRFSRQRLQS